MANPNPYPFRYVALGALMTRLQGTGQLSRKTITEHGA